MHMPNPESTAQIAGHPIHPMLVPFPIAFFVATLGCDLAYWWTGNPSWTTAALWLLGAGIVTAVFAALTGVLDFAGDKRIRDISDAWHHAIGNVIAVTLAIASWIWRYTHDASAVVPVGLTLSVVIALLLLFTGWKGGELVFRHRVAVQDADRTPVR